MFQKLKPHIFTVGEQTYRNVKSLIEPVNQSIVVSGESGAGKVSGLVHTQLGRQRGRGLCL
jgi:myosin heavy subunit